MNYKLSLFTLPGFFWLLLIFIPVICSGGNAGTPPGNSNTTKDDSLKLAIELHRQGDSLLDQMGYRAAEKLFIRAYAIARQLDEKRLMGKLSNNLAECYSMTGRSAKAEATYKDAVKLYEALHDTNAMAVILINLGDEYAKTGRTELAAETELKAIRLKEAANDFRKLAFYYQKLGELFIDRDNARWEQYAMKALELSRTEEYTTLRATIAIYNDLGAIWRIKGDFEKAAAYYDTMYRISAEADYPKGIATATSERALMLYDLGRYREALPMAEKAYEMVLETDDNYQIVYDASLIARILIKLGQHGRAVELLKMVIERAHIAGLIAEEQAGHKYLSEAYRASGRWQDALLSLERYHQLKDSIDGVEVQNALNNLQTRFETEKKQQLIDRLNEKNLAHEKRNRLFIGLLLVSVLVLLLLVLIIRLRNRTIRQNKALRARDQEIHKLESEHLTLSLAYKTRELSTATLHLINKNEVLNDLKNKLEASEPNQPELRQVIRQIDQNINLDNDWQNFSRHFEEVHPGFFRKLKEKFSSLTPNEERLCAYLAINLNTKEISQMLNVTTAAVDKSRNRLRRKLEILPEVNLNEFLKQL
ncbi:MAG: tetratricopeptide repeat protein [Lentimicrobium sp.]|nr:tetratricopeptide repeat protein [Lentimicrobium sp.]